MHNTYYFVRHAHSSYSKDELNRPLSKKGFASLNQLELLNDAEIDMIFSSPFKRAIQTITPLARYKQLKIIEDVRLIERKLSHDAISDKDFLPSINHLWNHPAFNFPGGESNSVAQARALNFLNEQETNYTNKTIVVSSHGNLISILLNHFDVSIDVDFWLSLTTPDIIKLDRDNSIDRFNLN